MRCMDFVYIIVLFDDSSLLLRYFFGLRVRVSMIFFFPRSDCTKLTHCPHILGYILDIHWIANSKKQKTALIQRLLPRMKAAIRILFNNPDGRLLPVDS